MNRDTSAAAADSATRRKPRLPILLCGLALSVIAYGYTLTTTPGLLILALLTTAVAVLAPRVLPPTMRAMIWSLLLMALLAAAANIRHLVPDNETLLLGMPAYTLERVATFAFAVGLTALLFRPTRDTVTLAILAYLPVAIIALERAREASAGNMASWLAILSLILIALATQAERASHRAADGAAGPGWRQWLPRIALAAIWVALSATLAAPADKTADSLRHWLYRLSGFEQSERTKPRLLNRSLSLAPPAHNWERRTRIVMEIAAPRAPGYLREAVYRTYSRNQWVGRSRATCAPPEWSPLPPAANSDWHGYALAPATEITPGEVWNFRPWRARSLASFCLPGTARAFIVPPAASPLATADGIVVLEEAAAPPAYQVVVAPPLPQASDGAPANAAFPWPDPQDDPAYLAIPPRLACAVSNWVGHCCGAAPPADTGAAIAAVTGYFREHFRYSLATAYQNGKSDKVQQFMANKAGHCTLFATAAALMLRQMGIPTRMVAGYLGTEFHPYTKRWVARERDGHAWCEAWDRERQQWLLVEATPAAGIPAAHKPPSRLTVLSEWLTALWRGAIDKIQTAAPLLALATLLANLFHWLWAILQTAIGLTATMLLLLLGLAWRWLKKSRPKESHDERLRRLLVARMATLERHYAPPHLRRLPHEPWQLWLQRITPSLPPAAADKLRKNVAEYQTLRYRPTPDQTATHAWLQKKRHHH